MAPTRLVPSHIRSRERLMEVLSFKRVRPGRFFDCRDFTGARAAPKRAACGVECYFRRSETRLQCIYRVGRDGILGNVPGKRRKTETIALRTELAAPAIAAKTGAMGQSPPGSPSLRVLANGIIAS